MRFDTPQPWPQAIAFTLRQGANDTILPRIYQMLRQAEAHADITESRLNGTIYVGPLTTKRAQKRAKGVLKGFSHYVEQDSVVFVNIDEVEAIFNDARRRDEK